MIVGVAVGGAVIVAVNVESGVRVSVGYKAAIWVGVKTVVAANAPVKAGRGIVGPAIEQAVPSSSVSAARTQLGLKTRAIRGMILPTIDILSQLK